jgi:hypothetical protein
MRAFVNSRVMGALMMTLSAGLAPAAAQTRPAERLAQAKTLKCTFTVMATGTWRSGDAQTESRPMTLSIGFDAINVDEGTARVIGAFGPSEIIVRIAYGTLHFMQSFREGPLYVTTIFPKETREGRMQAVHTRHEYTEVSLPGFTSRPEQYYGDCSVTP